MLRRIWQWLKGLFQRLFGGESRPSSSGRQVTHATSQDVSTPKPLDDSDYEYLFRQLLEGVAHSWQQERILQWFEGLKGRITYAEWVAWLNRFGERVLASSAPNDELARRLVLLGEQIQFVPSLQDIGVVAYDIGRQLLLRETGGAVWEYEGPDVPSLAPPYHQEQIQQEAEPAEAITLDELLERMQQDPNLVQVLAQQLGIETSDPQVIIQEVVNQLNAANQATADEAEALLQQSIQQFQAGEHEVAITSINRATEIAPTNPTIWFARAELMGILGQFEEAVASYDKAIEINPNIHEAWQNRGSALSNLGRLDEANASFDKAREILTNLSSNEPK